LVTHVLMFVRLFQHVLQHSNSRVAVPAVAQVAR
jgi:hypothetical protein